MKRTSIVTLLSLLANLAPLAPGLFSARVHAAEGVEVNAADGVKVTAGRARLENAWRNNHAVKLESDGALAGVVRRYNDAGVLVSAGKVRVYLYSNGTLVRIARTDDDGNFQAVVNPGVYSIMAGDLGDTNGFAGTMINVLPPDPPPAPLDVQSISAPGELPQPTVPAPAPAQAPAAGQQGRPSPKRLELCLIHPSDVAKLRTRLTEAARNRQLARAPAEAAVARRESGPQRDLFTLLGGRDAESKPSQRGAALVKVALNADDLNRLNSIPFDGPWHLGHQLYIRNDGSLHGRMRTLDSNGTILPAAGVDVQLLRRALPNSITQGRATTSAGGSFVIRDVDPAVYSVIAVSPGGGFGAFGVRLLPAGDNGTPVPQLRNASFNAQAEGQDDQNSDVDTSVVNDTDGNAFLANGAVNGLGTPGAPVGGAVTGPAGGGGSFDPFASALLGAGLGAATGYAIAEALSSP